ncbi:hypothetical protein [Nonomuraea cavernae]|uniref:hypothetical protein n=1 Tax=Nonomuraea cavernae TaxID=2045107 RepID=UPI0033DA4520
MRQLRCRPRSFGTVILALLIPLAACSPSDGGVTATARQADQPSDAEGVDHVRTVGHDPKIVVRTSTLNFLVAVKGELSYNSANRCLELMMAGSRPVGLVWPKGTIPAWINSKRGVTVPNVGNILQGASLDLVGGYEKWGKDVPFGYRVDGDIGCLTHAPNGDVFVIGSVESVGV